MSKKKKLNISVTIEDQQEDENNFMLYHFLKSIEQKDKPIFIPSPQLFSLMLRQKNEDLLFDFNLENEIYLTEFGKTALNELKEVLTKVKISNSSNEEKETK